MNSDKKEESSLVTSRENKKYKSASKQHRSKGEFILNIPNFDTRIHKELYLNEKEILISEKKILQLPNGNLQYLVIRFCDI